jgi:hypothetical protein
MYEKLLKYLTDAIGVFVASASGFWGFALKFFYKIFQKQVVKVGENIDNKIEAKKEAEEKLEKLHEVIKNPESTNEQIIKAEDDFFNRP